MNKTLVRKTFRLATVRALWQSQRTEMRYWEIIADNLAEAGWSWGRVAIVDSRSAIDFQIFRTLVRIESGFTYLLVNRRPGIS